VAREIQRAGWLHARALLGGLEAWQRAGLPVEPRGTPHRIDEPLTTYKDTENPPAPAQ
jgi:3-mercaptopyruvate sulfurtransferase SseA